MNSKKGFHSYVLCICICICLGYKSSEIIDLEMTNRSKLI